MSKSLSEILTVGPLISDTLRTKLEADIKAWVADEVIGKDEEVTMKHSKFEITPDTKYFTVPKAYGIEANNLRAEQRKRLEGLESIEKN